MEKRKRREKRRELWERVESGDAGITVSWPDIQAVMFKAARRGKTAREFAAFWNVTICGARLRLEKLVNLKLATKSRCPCASGQLADYYELTLPH